MRVDPSSLKRQGGPKHNGAVDTSVKLQPLILILKRTQLILMDRRTHGVKNSRNGQEANSQCPKVSCFYFSGLGGFGVLRPEKSKQRRLQRVRGPEKST